MNGSVPSETCLYINCEVITVFRDGEDGLRLVDDVLDPRGGEAGVEGKIGGAAFPNGEQRVDQLVGRGYAYGNDEVPVAVRLAVGDRVENAPGEPVRRLIDVRVFVRLGCQIWNGVNRLLLSRHRSGVGKPQPCRIGREICKRYGWLMFISIDIKNFIINTGSLGLTAREWVALNFTTAISGGKSNGFKTCKVESVFEIFRFCCHFCTVGC